MADPVLPPTLQDLVEAEVTVAALPSVGVAVSAPAAGAYRLLRVAKPQQQTMLSKQCDLWSFIWTSTSVAADLVASLMASPAAEGTLCLEVGAGCGLCSLAAARGGAAVVCTDVVEDALTLVRLNAAKNGIGARDWARAEGEDEEAGSDALAPGTLATKQYNWGHPDGITPVLDRALKSYAGGRGRPPRSLLLVGADVLFLESNVRPILRTAQDAVKAAAAAGVSWTGCVLVDPGRTPRDTLEALAADYGLSVAVRWDGYSCATPYALMREVTVFVLVSTEVAGAPSPLQDAMKTLWFGDGGLGTRCAAVGAPPPSPGIAGGGKFGYTMPS